MKRYRVLGLDFDSSATILAMEIREEWDEKIKEQHRRNREDVKQELLRLYGSHAAEQKLQNLIDIGAKPLSILAFHNKFFEQIRRAFIIGSYYPALTAACALGERILNHLILILRNDFRNTPKYKEVYRKNSFDKWEIAIDFLESWQVLLPGVVETFRELAKLRHRSIHFNPAVDRDDRPLALQAIKCLNKIIGMQFGWPFSGFGSQPWFIPGIRGESYIKKDFENEPFIKHIYLPNCHLVGPRNTPDIVGNRFVVHDDYEYKDIAISDEQFRDILTSAKREK